MKTKCGKRIHLVGTGICRQQVFQVQENEAEEKDHEGWRLCRREGNKLIPIGKSKVIYELEDSPKP